MALKGRQARFVMPLKMRNSPASSAPITTRTTMSEAPSVAGGPL